MPTKPTKREKEQQQTYTGLVLIGAVAVLWIGVVLLMAEVTKNARPVFIVLGGVITVGLGYAYYDYSWKEDDEKTAYHVVEYDKQKEERERVVGFDENKQISKAEYDAAILKVRQEEERRVAEKEMELKQERERTAFYKKQAEHSPPGPAVAPSNDLTAENIRKAVQRAAQGLLPRSDDNQYREHQKYLEIKKDGEWVRAKNVRGLNGNNITVPGLPGKWMKIGADGYVKTD